MSGSAEDIVKLRAITAKREAFWIPVGGDFEKLLLGLGDYGRNIQ